MQVLITGAPQRTEVWDYPLEAIREAVVNAVVHRDYNDPGNVQLRIFDDRLEIWNPGQFPAEINLENLEQTNRSIPKNKVLANLFHRCDMIEGWGTGILRIIEEYKKHGSPAPEYRQTQGAVILSFPIIDYSDGNSHKVTDNQKEILKLISQNKEITTAAMAEAIGISKRKILDNINKLKDKGLVQRIGTPKNGHWKIIE